MSKIRPKLSIMTDPVPCGRYYFTEPVRHVARRVRDFISPSPVWWRSKYRGHFAVTRSMVEGLQKIGVHSNYNPRTLADVGEVVVVPSRFDPLRQAIQWKRTGYIRRLLAGPNIVVFPSDRRDLMTAPEVDVYITPDHWTRDLYVEDCPELRGRCVPWPAGVDTDYWKPNPNLHDRARVLIYEKQRTGPVGPVGPYAQILQRRGYQVDIIQSGKYTHSQYLRALQQSRLMIGFVRSESQGIAWTEAWSADVPTLIWRNDWYTVRQRTWRASTAPYLSPQTGLFFEGLSDFEGVLDQWERNQDQFHPRQWVLENMSDEVCARKLCLLAGLNEDAYARAASETVRRGAGRSELSGAPARAAGLFGKPSLY